MLKKYYNNHLLLKAFLCLVLSSLVAAAGCSDPRIPKGPKGTITGTVKYQGKPVTVGFISFLDPATGKGGTAPLESDGSYTIPVLVGVGEYHVGFPPPTPPAPWENVERVMSPLPSKYHTPELATLKYTVVEGENTANFDLE